MKQILLVALMVIGMASWGQQSYLIDPTSIWVQQEEYGGTYWWWTYNYYLTVGDTLVVNDTSYFKLFLTGQERYAYHGYPDDYTYFTDLYYGGIRSDSGKILFVLPDSNYSITLYDFNLIVGDTIHSVVGKNKIITEIDTLLDGRKKYFTNDSEFFLEEGIGSSFSLYNVKHLFSYLDWIASQKLGCYYQYDTMVFVNNQQVCDYYNHVGINDIPFNNDYKTLSVTYYNLLGQEIEKPKKGFYIERITSNRETVSKKYIIQ